MRGLETQLEGVGSLQWRLLGVFPLFVAMGFDITRSAVGCVQLESIWLPSVLCYPEVVWTESDAHHPSARFPLQGEIANLDLTLDAKGRVQAASLPRWGNPKGASFPYVNFGGTLEEEATFGGHTIPTRLRMGWYFGTERFETEGEFFRATIDNAIFR